MSNAIEKEQGKERLRERRRNKVSMHGCTRIGIKGKEACKGMVSKKKLCTAHEESKVLWELVRAWALKVKK
jgi:hypothetical protein